MTPKVTPSLPLLSLIAALITLGALLLSAGDSKAVQNPIFALDMVTAGNGYDATTGAMVVGAIDNCLTTEAPGNNDRHNHPVHLIVRDVEDLIGWQARLNYDGGRMRPSAVNYTPFTDSNTGQNISFINLPLNPATANHHDIVSASDIPPPAAEPQTALIAASYVGEQSAALYADTPPKAPPDDTSYTAPTGGILASVNLQVLPGQAGQPLLTMDLDDPNPNSPGSKVVVFDGTGQRDIILAEPSLFDGFHAEGSTCVPPPGVVPPPSDGGAAPPGAPGSTPGDVAPGGTSPGATSPGGATATDGASPSRTTTTSPTPDSETSDEDGADDGDDDGGTPSWVFVLIAVVIALAAGGAYAAWRYRSRLPWLNR